MSDLIHQMLDNIASDHQAEAQQDFNNIISTKLTNALDQRKQEVAQELGAHNVSVQADS